MLAPSSRLLRYALPVGGTVATAALGVAAYVTHVMNRPRPRTWQDEFSFSPFEVQVPCEDVSFPSGDGLTLRGWFFPRPDSDQVVVGCTGHRGAKYELLGIGAALWRAGKNVLLFDFRGCGDSDPAPITLAYNEVMDARAAVDFAAKRLPNARIGMIGYSMGAAVAILVAASDQRVAAVVADSSFTTIWDVVAYSIRRRWLPTSIVPLADVVNRWRYGYPFHAVRPIDVVGTIAPRPLLLIHGACDDLIPVEHARELYEAARDPRELWIGEGARHCGVYFRNRAEYVRRVAQFFADGLQS